ncbi:MAG: PTS sugar transporter subunit IIA [Limisphaerales bacterium]
MPHRTLGIEEVAQYLHLNPVEIERLVKEQDIPFERRGTRVVFRKVDIDAWASPRVLSMNGRRLMDYHQKSSGTVRQVSHSQAILPAMLRPEFIEPFLAAKTQASVLREMAALANRTRGVCDPAALLAGLEAREKLCSTGLPGGLAILHIREPEPYIFESMFLVLGRPVQQIHFGAPDGRPTDLFFLIACPDPSFHLHCLARLCIVAQSAELLDDLRKAPDAAGMYDLLIAAEQAALERARTAARSS